MLPGVQSLEPRATSWPEDSDHGEAQHWSVLESMGKTTAVADPSELVLNHPTWALVQLEKEFEEELWKPAMKTMRKMTNLC